VLYIQCLMMHPSGKRATRREELLLELACEWGSCQETFDRMQDFCQHVEKHYKATVDSETDLPGAFNTCGQLHNKHNVKFLPLCTV